MEINAMASLNGSGVDDDKTRVSYVHGCSTTSLLFDTIGQRLRMAAKKFPEREFVIFKREGIRKTYKEVLEDVSLGTGLLVAGVTGNIEGI